MPRSSKHKSSKHSSRDTREYSDSEKDSSLKDRKGKDESVAKDSSSSEKRKLDSKDVHGSGNAEYFDEYGSSKRRKERSNDGLGERWNGGDDDRGDGSKKFRTSGDSKSRRRDESVGVYGEAEELKKASGKSEAKHKDSGRKGSREGELGKERKAREIRSERSIGNEEHRISKQVIENTTDSKGLDEFRSPELDDQLESQMKKKRDDLVDGEKHQDDVGDSYDRRLSSRDDIAKDGRLKDDKQKDEKYRGKYREEMDRENKHRHDKKRDDRPAKNHTSNRADDKYTREEKDNAVSREKRTKLLESDLNHNRDCDEDRDCEPDSGHDRERHHERSRDCDRARDRDCDYDHDRDHVYDKDWGWDCDRDHDHERDRDRDRDRRREHEGSHVDDRSAKSKESGTKKRTLDDRPAKNHASNRAGDEYTREEKDNAESREKRTKLSGSDLNHNRDHDEDRDRELDSGHHRERHCERSRDRVRDRDRDRNCDFDYDHDRGHDFDKDWGWDCDRDHDRERDRDRDRDRRREHDGSHDDRSAKSKESGTKKRTLDDHDDYSDTKYRVVKARYSDAEKRSSRADSDADRGRSQPRQARLDSTGTSNKARSSPVSNSHVGKEEYRNVKSEDLKYRETIVEERAKGPREGFSGLSERPKYKSMEKTIKIDDGPMGDLSSERSSSSKASPMGLVERSPSSTSIDRRYMNRSGVKRSLEIEETGRRNSTDGRDFLSPKDRLSQELTLEKHQLDESCQGDSSFYGRNNQGNTSLIPPPPAFRSGPDRPFMGSLEDDVRDNSNARYRRSSDAGFGRGQGNSWRGVQNWTSTVPNGFLPFQHGPGGFQAMMPQFPSQPLFGVRPPIEVNHTGLPYHIPDADRFPGHLRPLGWQNMMDGAGPSHLHVWDSNGVFRDDPQMYGGSDWERNRRLPNSRGWDSGSETRKEENGNLKELSSATSKDESLPSLVDDGLADQDIQTSQDVHSCDSINEKALETKSFSLNSPVKGPVSLLSSGALEKVSDTSSDKSSLFSRFYLSKLDISAELAPPELYDQCVCLLNVKKNACVDVDASMDLYLKNGSRPRQIYAATLSRASPFPAIDTSVFQKAIDIYKKQRIKMPNGEKLDVISVFNQVLVDEPVTRPRSEAVQVSVSTSDSVVNMPMSTLDPKEVHTISPAKEDLDEIEPTHSHNGNDQVCNHSLQVAVSGPSFGHNNQGESSPGSSEKKDEVTSEQVNLGHAEEACSKAVKTPSQLVTSLQGGENMNAKGKISVFAQSVDEKLGFNETSDCSLVFEDGSGKACDALMPGSNESELLIFSRIHHSPESTH